MIEWRPDPDYDFQPEVMITSNTVYGSMHVAAKKRRVRWMQYVQLVDLRFQGSSAKNVERSTRLPSPSSALNAEIRHHKKPVFADDVDSHSVMVVSQRSDRPRRPRDGQPITRRGATRMDPKDFCLPRLRPH